MQQAYQALRIVSEAQTVRIVLASQPGELELRELTRACAGLQSGSDDGIKAVVLDFDQRASAERKAQSPAPELLLRARDAVRSIPQPVLAIARARLSEIASQLLAEADFTLIAHEATLPTLEPGPGNAQSKEETRINGLAAYRLGYATWTASLSDIRQEMERILDLLRGKSAIALRRAKASVHLAGQQTGGPLAALQQVNSFYLTNVMSTEDAREGLMAFLAKRPPRWTNR